MYAHKWGLNCHKLLAKIPQEKWAKVIRWADEDNSTIRALGIAWDAENDAFSFPKGPPALLPWTLKSVTSLAGQFFDPLILLVPTTLPAKLLIHHAWQYQESWDQLLPERPATKMTLYCKDQGQLDQINYRLRFRKKNEPSLSGGQMRTTAV